MFSSSVLYGPSFARWDIPHTRRLGCNFQSQQLRSILGDESRGGLASQHRGMDPRHTTPIPQALLGADIEVGITRQRGTAVGLGRALLCRCCRAGNVQRMHTTAKKKPLLAGLNPTPTTLVSPSPPWGDGLSPSPSPPAAAVPLHFFNHLPLLKTLTDPRSCPPSQPPKSGAGQELATPGHPSTW